MKDQELAKVIEDVKFHLRNGDVYLARRVMKAFGRKSPYPVPPEWRDYVRLGYYIAVNGDKRE
jgi:hypothetical protein